MERNDLQEKQMIGSVRIVLCLFRSTQLLEYMMDVCLLYRSEVRI